MNKVSGTKDYILNGAASTSVCILGAAFVLLFGFGFAVTVFMQMFSDDIYAIRKNSLENIVSLAQNGIEAILEEKRDGKITNADARIKATEVINRFIYYDKGAMHYVFLATYEGYVLADSGFPDAVGTYQMQRRDSQGTPVTQLLLEKAKNGGGFVQYYEVRPNGGKAQKKLSFVVGIPDIGCYLGSGIYVEDIDLPINLIKQRLLYFGSLIILVILGMQYYFMRPLMLCVSSLEEIFKRISDKPDSLSLIRLPSRFKSYDTNLLLESLKDMFNKLNAYRLTVEQSVEKYRRIAYAGNDVIWEWNSQSKSVTLSGNINEVFGYETREFNTHYDVFEEWVHPEDQEMRHHALELYLSGSVPYYLCEYRIWNKRLNGYRRILARGGADFDEQGALIRMVGSFTVISELADPLINRQEQNCEIEPCFQSVSDITQHTPFVNSDILIIQVKELLNSGQWQGIVVVEDKKPIGLIMKDSLYYKLSGHYGVSLYYRKPVKLVMDYQPLIIESNFSLEQAADAARKRPEANLYDLVIVTENGEYSGTVSVMELLSHLTDLRIQLAANANPLTGLPGNLLIEEKLKQAIKHYFAVLYIDLDNFKAFNDKYGFEMGDLAIKMTATILEEVAIEYKDNKVFLGHIGGDDFIVLLAEREEAEEFANKFIEQFDDRIRTLYQPSDLKKGYISAVDRKGLEQKYPIMSVSIALVDNYSRTFTNYLETGEIAAQLKRRAKMMAGSVWVSERRYNDKL